MGDSYRKKQELKDKIVKLDSFLKIKKENFLKNYVHIKDIGKGAFGTVSKIKMKRTGLKRAAKTIQIPGSDFEKSQENKIIN